MSVYTRRFLADPGDTVLLNIESVNILDLTPPANIQGVGSGTVILVGEFEKGPYATPQQLLGTSDLARTWGTLGYTYGGLVAQYPSAPVRYADSAIAPEYWNGNAFVQICGQTYASLILVRVNTSIGAVTFESQAYVEGAVEFAYSLTSGQILSLALPTLTTNVTVAANVGSTILYVQSTAGFAGTGTIEINGTNITYTAITGGANPSFTLTSALATAIAANTIVLGGTLSATSATFTGLPATVTGTGAAFGSITAGLTVVLAYDGNPNFTTTFQAGDTTISAVVARINSYAGYTMASNNAGQLALTGRIPGTSGSIQVVSGTALTDLGLTAATTAGTGNVKNITHINLAEIQTIVQTAIAGTKVELNASGALRISNTATPGTGGIYVSPATTALGLGFTIGEIASAGDNAGGVIPAGTVVQDAGAANILVTTQDLTILPNAPGPYTVPVRYAIDNGTGAGTSANTITVIAAPPALGSFAVTNANAISPAMTETQIDAAYTAAIATTTDVNSVARLGNIIVSARQSNVVRSQLRANAIAASSKGCYGRVACVSPPLNTSPQVALSTTTAPGVGATSDQRVIYCYVGFNVFVPLIGQVGTAGGIGFNASGNVDVHSDTWMASILSQLNPEENPGQDTTFTANVNGIETGANVQGFDINSYIAFKAAGIAAARMDGGVAIFQSGVTSVNPLTYPSLTRISRRRMADYIQDSIAVAANSFGKKLSVQARRKALKSEIRSFLAGLLSKNNPGSQRINGYTVSDSDGNTDVTLSEGMYRITVNVKTIASLDSIVVQTTVGEDVDVTEVLPQAA